ncbi:MAG: DNA translocase FtsK 4TM domain-containing protein, partial [Nitrosomonas sp.]|nr:DNA translocase FtsK 4TM domain-containing protein [Nitrosomonas sp.]
MSFADKPMAKKVASNPLPPRTSRLLREAVSLVLSGIALYLALILISFDRTDPGWSHSGTLRQVSNAGGSAGAWLADLMLYFFGISAWWWVVFFFATVWWGYRRIDIASVFDPRVLMLSFTGFITLLVASSGIEALRFHTLRISLPLAPGGLLGEILSKQLSSLLGFTGATLAMVIIFAIGFSLFSGLSWVRLSEKIGGGIEEICFAVRDICTGWMNRRNGTIPSSEREVHIEEIGKQPFPLGPLHIEMPETTPPRSTRSNREKQTPQFSNSPDGIIPPLNLLDEPQSNVEMLSSDTLEFTSRLIERKLQEFGVEVKVVAAYPGPVITRYEIEPAVGVKGNQIVNLVRDLARALTVASIRVVETIPGKTVMGLEIPNPNRQTVRLHEILASGVYANNPSPLTIALGKDISGRPVVSDLAKMPHALVAGTTGSGKSVAINAIILSLVYKASPDNVRL